ncbi:chaplin family protein [Actinomadura hibisca]|uniref:chaplin family protein n=1 Tax=Actinomadura hibisca TaxID=68565 RepID=UPI0008299BA2|nr:chaplin family protein [Actinomadura hibisca]
MRTWAKGTARSVALTASFVALGATVVPATAFADTTSGESGVLGGNQVNLPVSAPIDVSGNAVGNGTAASKGGAHVHNGGSGGGQTTSGKHGVASGNQVNAPISAPVNACGNSLALFGQAEAGCKGGATVNNSGGGGQKTSGQSGVASGNQVNAPISVPVNACGNAAAIFGSADAGCKGGAKADNGSGGGQLTSGQSGVIAGNQVNAPVSAPVNICGNAAAIFGEAVAGCEGGATVKNGGHTGAGQKTSGKSSVGGGNQVNAPISAPVDVCGNAVGNAVADCDGGASVRNGGHGSGGQQTNGDYSVLGGNQANAPVSVPVSACGNAVAVLGEAGAFCQGGAHVRSSSGGGQTTSGQSGVLAGNQANAPVNIPVNVCGNAVAVLGSAAAGCDGSAVVEGPQGSGNHTKGGNQVNAPGKAPVDVCGNVVAVAGKPKPQCDDGPSWGGYQSYEQGSRTAGVPGLPAVPGTGAAGVPALPAVPELAKALPVSPAAAMPALPKLPAAPTGLAQAPAASRQASAGNVLPGNVLPASALPTDALSSNVLPANALPASALSGEALPGNALPGVPVAGLPALPGVQQVTGQLPVAPALDERARAAKPKPPIGSLPMVGTLPPKPESLPVLGGLVPKPKSKSLPVNAPVDTAKPPVDAAKSPVGLPKIPGLPGNGVLRTVPAVPVTPMAPAPAARTQGLPAAGLPNTPLPATGVPALEGVKLPGLGALPVSGDIKAPEVGGVTDKTAGVTGVAEGATGDLGAIKPVAAIAPVGGGDERGGSLWVLAAAAMMTAMSGAAALSRRFRLGRR